MHQHTMMDMIRIGFPGEPERYEQAKTIFNRQTAGLASMKEAFAVAGPLTKGLSLRSAIEYALGEMRYLNGFGEFVSELHRLGILFAINSTGYSVTIETIKSLFGHEKIGAAICNRLVFGWLGNPDSRIGESELAELVKDYVSDGNRGPDYDEILAVGEVELGIRDENDKADLIFEIADRKGIPRKSVAHMGDTMGDSGGITGVAQKGGLGIAFNYNEALGRYLEDVMESMEFSGKIILADPKGEQSDLRRVLRIMEHCSDK